MMGKRFLFESIASRSGLYRTVLILDGQPLSFTIEGELYSWLDWRSSGTDMLQIPIKLSEDCEKSGSFFAVSTPIDTESLPLSSLASAKNTGGGFPSRRGVSNHGTDGTKPG